MRRRTLLFLFSFIFFFLGYSQSFAAEVSKGSWAKKHTADHSQFEALQKDFDFGPDVTEACISCHTEAPSQIHKTFHWNWKAKVKGKEIGKGQGMMNNYCVSARGNQGRCTSCHIGFGWRDDDFEFDEETNIDCMVCHDTTGDYKKFPIALGHPAYEDTVFDGKQYKKVDLKKVAMNVGKPQRHNCLSCHALGGGGNGVKHGDTDLSLVNPKKALDVHMDSEGLNFSCQDCHTADEHRISGRYYDRKAFLDYKADMGRRDRKGKNVSCESCHTETPHEESRLNRHTQKVACASCHIPKFARGGYLTKMKWDWSTAGKMKDGKPFKEMAKFDGLDAIKYVSKKGTFDWGQNVIPEYYWYKGEMDQLTFEDKIDPSKAPIILNAPSGSYRDSMAKIWPFKVHRGKQPYDTVHKTLLPIKLFGRKGSGALWADYKWPKALELGAENNEVPYSGKYDFVRTDGYWLIKHMVAPKEDAVSCSECHSKDSRLKGLNDFYLVGRDANSFIDILGILMIIGTVMGVCAHGIVLIISRRKNRKE